MVVIHVLSGKGKWRSDRDKYANITGAQGHVTRKDLDVLFFAVVVPAHRALPSWHLGDVSI